MLVYHSFRHHNSLHDLNHTHSPYFRKNNRYLSHPFFCLTLFISPWRNGSPEHDLNYIFGGNFILRKMKVNKSTYRRIIAIYRKIRLAKLCITLYFNGTPGVINISLSVPIVCMRWFISLSSQWDVLFVLRNFSLLIQITIITLDRFRFVRNIFDIMVKMAVNDIFSNIPFAFKNHMILRSIFSIVWFQNAKYNEF